MKSLRVFNEEEKRAFLIGVVLSSTCHLRFPGFLRFLRNVRALYGISGETTVFVLQRSIQGLRCTRTVWALGTAATRPCSRSLAAGGRDGSRRVTVDGAQADAGQAAERAQRAAGRERAGGGGSRGRARERPWAKAMFTEPQTPRPRGRRGALRCDTPSLKEAFGAEVLTSCMTRQG